MKVCLIGSMGFLAQSIARYADNHGMELHVIGKTNPSYPVKSFTYSILEEPDFPVNICIQCDVIFYTAAAGVQANEPVLPENIYHINTFFPIALCEKLNRSSFCGSFISLGSYFEIGNNSENKLFSELDILQSLNSVPNDYCRSKRLITRYFQDVSLKYTYLHCILPTIYGELEKSHRLIPYLISTISQGESPVLTSGEQIREYIYVNDVVKLLFLSIKNIKDSGIYNFFAAETLSVKELAISISKYFDVELPPSSFGAEVRTDTSMKNLQLNTQKIEKYIPRPSLHKIEDIIKNYIDNESN